MTVFVSECINRAKLDSKTPGDHRVVIRKISVSTKEPLPPKEDLAIVAVGRLKGRRQIQVARSFVLGAGEVVAPERFTRFVDKLETMTR